MSLKKRFGLTTDEDRDASKASFPLSGRVTPPTIQLIVDESISLIRFVLCFLIERRVF